MDSYPDSDRSEGSPTEEGPHARGPRWIQSRIAIGWKHHQANHIQEGGAGPHRIPSRPARNRPLSWRPLTHRSSSHPRQQALPTSTVTPDTAAAAAAVHGTTSTACTRNGRSTVFCSGRLVKLGRRLQCSCALSTHQPHCLEEYTHLVAEAHVADPHGIEHKRKHHDSAAAAEEWVRSVQQGIWGRDSRICLCELLGSHVLCPPLDWASKVPDMDPVASSFPRWHLLFPGGIFFPPANARPPENE